MDERLAPVDSKICIPMTANPAPARRTRLEELDVLRGLAALGVVLFHYVLQFEWVYGHSVTLIPVDNWTKDEIKLFGQLPVRLFFMISGFVIFWTLERSKSLTDFAVSRFSRLFPAYWAAVLITFLIGTLYPLPAGMRIISAQEYAFPQLIANLTMVQAYVQIPDIDGVYWSLAYELGFYITMAVATAIGLLVRPKLLCFMWLAGSAACVLNPALWQFLPYPIAILVVAEFTGYFVGGMLFYRIWQRQADRTDLILLLFAILVVFLWTATWGAFVSLGLFVVLGLISRGKMSFINFRPLIWLGGISYPLYLIHQMLGYRLILELESVGFHPILAIAITLLAALLLATAISLLVERPALHIIRKNWAQRKAGQSVNPAH